MKLVELSIRSIPGIRDPYTVGALDPGLNLVVGPNGSGKSTLLRALRALLWRMRPKDASHVLDARWVDGNDALEASRAGTTVTWSRNGTECDPPPLPPSHPGSHRHHRRHLPA